VIGGAAIPAAFAQDAPFQDNNGTMTPSLTIHMLQATPANNTVPFYGGDKD
jgi:hypothetical protein